MRRLRHWYVASPSFSSYVSGAQFRHLVHHRSLIFVSEFPLSSLHFRSLSLSSLHPILFSLSLSCFSSLSLLFCSLSLLSSLSPLSSLLSLLSFLSLSLSVSLSLFSLFPLLSHFSSLSLLFLSLSTSLLYHHTPCLPLHFLCG